MGAVGWEGQRTGHRGIVAIHNGRAKFAGVVHRHCGGRRFAQLHGDVGPIAFGDWVIDGAKAQGQGAHGRGAIERHIIQVVNLRAGGSDSAKSPAVDFGQAQAIVGCAIADLFAAQVGKGDLDLAPAAKVILQIHRPALGVIFGGAGVAVVKHVNKEGGVAVVAVEPEGEAGIGAPVLRHPLVDGGVFKAVGKAGKRDDVDIHFQHVVRRGRPWYWSRRRVGRGDGDGAIGVLEGAEADANRAIQPGR